MDGYIVSESEYLAILDACRVNLGFELEGQIFRTLELGTYQETLTDSGGGELSVQVQDGRTIMIKTFHRR